jgi:hypothetical protein
MNSFFKILRRSINDILKNKFDYLFMFYNLLFIVGSFKQLESDEALIVNFLLILFLTTIKGKIEFTGLPVILGFFTLLLFLPTIIWGFSGEKVYLGFYLRILTGVLIINYFRAKFFIIFENFMFIMALISLPFFLIQILNIQFFDLFKGFSESVLNEERLKGGFGQLVAHRYLIIFLVNSWAETRNSGFAWEPAGFGALLMWASTINLIMNKFKMNFKLFILVFTALTTFSLGTYVTLFALMIFLFYNARDKRSLNFIMVGLILVSLFFSISFFSQMTNFMSWKTQIYLDSVEHKQYEKDIEKGNRVTGALSGINLLIKSPLGYGLDPDRDTGYIKSANGFMNMMYKYGFVGGILIVILLFRLFTFFKVYFFFKLKGKLFFLLIFILTFNGNPFYHQPFFLALLISGYLNLKYFLQENLRISKLHRSTSEKSLLHN